MCGRTSACDKGSANPTTPLLMARHDAQPEIGQLCRTRLAHCSQQRNEIQFLLRASGSAQRPGAAGNAGSAKKRVVFKAMPSSSSVRGGPFVVGDAAVVANKHLPQRNVVIRTGGCS